MRSVFVCAFAVSIHLASFAWAADYEIQPNGGSSDTWYVEGPLSVGTSSGSSTYRLNVPDGISKFYSAYVLNELGVGVENPDYALEIDGSIGLGDSTLSSNASALVIESYDTGDDYIELRSNDDTYGIIIRQDTDDGNYWSNIETNTGVLHIGYNNDNGGINLSDADCLRIDSGGSTCADTEGLRVDGKARIYGNLYSDSSCSALGPNADCASGWEVYVDDDLWADGTVSAGTVTDRTPYPFDTETAYSAVLSMARLPDGEYDENDDSKQLDHSALHPFVLAKPVGENDPPGRNLSATVSAQNEVLKDLITRLEEQEARISELEANVCSPAQP